MLIWGCGANYCRHGTCRSSRRLWARPSRRSAPTRSMMPCTGAGSPISAAISNLPKPLRARLERNLPLGLPEIERRYDSSTARAATSCGSPTARRSRRCGCRKGNASTICISSQVGCPVDCKFCLTALLGLERNLTAGEIAGQVLRVAAENQLEANADRLNIVMMGQGEPLLNLANVIKATRLLTDPDGHRDFAAPHHAFDLRHHPQDRWNWRESRCGRSSPFR